jgi:PKD repeat protein
MGVCREVYMKKLAALASAALLVACQDPIAPRPAGIDKPSRPVSDHVSHTFAIAFQSCGFTGPSWFSFYECFIGVSQGDGTFRSYGNGTPVVFDENGNPSGVASRLLHPTWSPDASKIAADNDSDVLVITLSDSTFANLTNHPAHDYSPSWSPNGARIAFVSDRDGLPSLYLMNATNGSSVTRVTNGVEVRGKATWSPNAGRLAFTCVVESPNLDVCAVNADGSGFARLTTTRADRDPDWSPDGSRIAFVTGRFGTGGEIATMAPDGSNVTRISRLDTSASYRGYGNPDWSPDGTRIAYSKGATQPSACDGIFPCRIEPGLFVMNADGSGVGQVVVSTFPEWKPGVAIPPATDEPPVARLTYTCTNLDCYFYGYTSTDDHGIGGYRWSFGDGTTDYNYNSPYSVLFHRYAAPGTYTVVLTVTDYDGHSASVTLSVTVTSAAPTASFVSNCGAGRTCSFDGSGSTDDQGIVSRTWLFGDGSTLNDVIAHSHSYAVNGTYQVTLTVRDAVGQSSSVTHTVTVRDDAPVAHFSWSCSSGWCTFDGRASTDDWFIGSYQWDLGRYGTASGAVVSIPVKGRSTFTAKLTVTDQAGQTNSITKSVTLK